MGPVADILRQYNQAAVIQHIHKTAFKDAVVNINNEDWRILPNRIKWHTISNFPGVAADLHFDVHLVFMQY